MSDKSSSEPPEEIGTAHADKLLDLTRARVQRDPDSDCGVIKVNKLRYLLIGAFQAAFTMESKHVGRIAERVARELFALGIDPPSWL